MLLLFLWIATAKSFWEHIVNTNWIFEYKPHFSSRSTNGNIRPFIEQTENVYIVKFQCLINYALTSGKFANSIFKNWEAVGAWFANSFIDLCLY